MKKLLLILTLFWASICALHAQHTFAPIGATWHYTGSGDMYYLPGQDGAPPESYWNDKVVSEKDTLINNITCQKLLVTDSREDALGNPVVISNSTLFVYDNTDTVFFYANDSNQFEPLYIFNVNQGDTVHLSYFDITTSKGQQPFIYTVDSIRNEAYGSASLKSVYTHILSKPLDSVAIAANWGQLQYLYNNYGVYSFIFHGKYTEKIGGYLGFFPTRRTILVAGGPGASYTLPAGNLQCYQDSVVNYQANDTLACDYLPVTTGINAINTNAGQVLVYPNPANNWVHIAGLPDKSGIEIQLYDLSGKCLQRITTKRTDKEAVLNIGNLASGYYWLRCVGNGFTSTGRFCKLGH